jgi:hypothetical protein
LNPGQPFSRYHRFAGFSQAQTPVVVDGDAEHTHRSPLTACQSLPTRAVGPEQTSCRHFTDQQAGQFGKTLEPEQMVTHFCIPDTQLRTPAYAEQQISPRFRHSLKNGQKQAPQAS